MYTEVGQQVGRFCYVWGSHNVPVYFCGPRTRQDSHRRHPGSKSAFANARYVKRRDRRFGARSDGPFLVNKNGNHLDKGEVHRAFYILSRQIGLRGANASRGPRLHDFRHRFAVETLLRWYRSGDDPKRRLPILSTYLGHAHVTDTYWYLTGTPELLGAAGARLEKRWESLNA
jgi:hypothetical protein